MWVKAKVTLLLILVACGITSAEGWKLRVRVSLKGEGRLFGVQNIEPIFCCCYVAHYIFLSFNVVASSTCTCMCKV